MPGVILYFIVFFVACVDRADIVFVVDVSTSVFHERGIDAINDFLCRFLLPANIDSGDVRVGLLLFSTKVHIRFHMNAFDTKREVYEHINVGKYGVGGNTNTADALKAMNEVMFIESNGDRPNVKNIGVILTDGKSTDSTYVPQEAERAELNGIHIFAIGVGLRDTDELKEIASVPASKNAFVLQGFDELRVFDERFFQFCPGINVFFTNSICFAHFYI